MFWLISNQADQDTSCYNNNNEINMEYFAMSKTAITVAQSAKIATRHPQQCAQLFLNNVFPMLEQEAWFSKAWCLKFCALFLQNIVDHSVDVETDQILVARVLELPIHKALPLLRKHPEDAVALMVVMVSNQLRSQQRLSTADQYAFYNELFAAFFPSETTASKNPTMQRSSKSDNASF